MNTNTMKTVGLVAGVVVGVVALGYFTRKGIKWAFTKRAAKQLAAREAVLQTADDLTKQAMKEEAAALIDVNITAIGDASIATFSKKADELIANVNEVCVLAAASTAEIDQEADRKARYEVKKQEIEEANSIVYESAEIKTETTPDAKVIKCVTFVIPNSYCRLDKLFMHEALVEKWQFWLGVTKVDPNEKLVQVWTHDGVGKDSNWQDHQPEEDVLAAFDALGNRKKSKAEREHQHYLNFWPGFVPYSLIKNVKDGDVIKFYPRPDIVIEMTCTQQGGRYGDIGNFNELVTLVTSPKTIEAYEDFV